MLSTSLVALDQSYVLAQLEAYVYAQMRKIGVAVISAGRVDYRCG